MKAGTFNFNDYINKLNEAAEAGSVKDSGEGLMIQDGESKKAYDWLKKEYSKGKTEVKVEMKMGGQKFEPSIDFQTDVKTTKNFKSGIFGEIKTSDTEAGTKDSSNKDSIDKSAGNEDDSNESSEKKEKKSESVKIEATTKKKKEEDTDGE